MLASSRENEPVDAAKHRRRGTILKSMESTGPPERAFVEKQRGGPLRNKKHGAPGPAPISTAAYSRQTETADGRMALTSTAGSAGSPLRPILSASKATAEEHQRRTKAAWHSHIKTLPPFNGNDLMGWLHHDAKYQMPPQFREGMPASTLAMLDSIKAQMGVGQPPRRGNGHEPGNQLAQQRASTSAKAAHAGLAAQFQPKNSSSCKQ